MVVGLAHIEIFFLHPFSIIFVIIQVVEVTITIQTYSCKSQVILKPINTFNFSAVVLAKRHWRYITGIEVTKVVLI